MFRAYAVLVPALILLGGYMLWQASSTNPGSSERFAAASPTREAARVTVRVTVVVQVTPTPTPLSARQLTETARPTRTPVPFLTRVRATATPVPTSTLKKPCCGSRDEYDG